MKYVIAYLQDNPPEWHSSNHPIKRWGMFTANQSYILKDIIQRCNLVELLLLQLLHLLCNSRILFFLCLCLCVWCWCWFTFLCCSLLHFFIFLYWSLFREITIATFCLKQLRKVGLAIDESIKSSIGWRAEKTSSMCTPKAWLVVKLTFHCQLS